MRTLLQVEAVGYFISSQKSRIGDGENPIGGTSAAPVTNIRISSNENSKSLTWPSISARIDIRKEIASSSRTLLLEPCGENLGVKILIKYPLRIKLFLLQVEGK